MTVPRLIEHSKNYLVNIQVFGDRLIETSPLKLNYLATSFEINHSGGSNFVHQKGRKIASAFPTQPTNTVTLNCLMFEADFSALASTVIVNQQQVLVTLGKLEYNVEQEDINIIHEDSQTIFEAIGYLADAQISARVGEYMNVSLVLNVDDINEYNVDNLPSFNP